MNKKVILVKRPDGLPKLNDFEIKIEPISINLSSGEVLVKVLWSSIDPAQRVWISGRRKTHFPSVAIGHEIRAYGIGEVVKSTVGYLKPGTHVYGLLGWQEFCKIDHRRVFKLPNEHPANIYLGVLGLPGLSAYVAVVLLARPNSKDVVVVSSAAGSVGSVACQIAKMRGCFVVGITGSSKKCDWLLTTIKLDGVINYKTQNVQSTLSQICNKGVDVYIDNVGGSISDAVLANINKYSRVVLCGAISGYNLEKNPGIKNYPNVISLSGTMIGFMVNDFRSTFTLALKTLSKWLAEGKIVFKEHVLESLEQAPQGLIWLMEGKNQGKLLIKLNPSNARL
jgi:NADPH-dependent curcumin reductase CurA